MNHCNDGVILKPKGAHTTNHGQIGCDANASTQEQEMFGDDGFGCLLVKSHSCHFPTDAFQFDLHPHLCIVMEPVRD